MLNVTVLTGRLVADPELKHTPNNVAVTTFTIAVDRSYVRTGAERQTDFIDIVAWRATADFICRYFRKGSLISIQGSIQTSTYEDKQGNKRKKVEVVVDNAHFAESKRDGGVSQGTTTSPATHQFEEPAPVSYSNGNTGDFIEMSNDTDDLPF